MTTVEPIRKIEDIRKVEKILEKQSNTQDNATWIVIQKIGE